MKRVRVHIAGRVQGVGFRFEMRDRARSRGLGGWVRNAPDGAVEAVFEGSAEDVDSILAWCRRGPRGASVEQVESVDETPAGETGFAIR